jgi:hypothetical protein
MFRQFQRIIAPFRRLRYSEKVTVIFALVGVVFTGIQVWYADKSIKNDNEIAKISGAFDKADSYLGFWDLGIPSNGTDTIQLIYGGNFEKGSINISSFPFSICNYGKRNAEDVELIIEYPAVANLAITDSTLIGNELPVTEYHRRAIYDGVHATIAYRLNRLNPGVRVTLQEPFILYETTIKASSKLDNPPIHSYEAQYSLIFSTTLLCKDLQTQRRNFAITCLEASNMDELVDKYVKTIKRTSSKGECYYFVFPDKKLIDRRGGSSIHEYKVTKESLYFGMIEDLSKYVDVALALYGNDQKLNKIRVYDASNTLKKIIAAE